MPTMRAARPGVDGGVLVAVLVVVLSGLGAAGCAARDPGATPETAIVALAEALRAGRYADAYALMSADYRRRVSEDAFVRHLRDHDAEALELGESLSSFDGVAEETASVDLGGGETAALVREG